LTITAKYPWEYVKGLSADDFCDILLRGKDEKEKDRLFFRWCLLEVHNMGEPINFEDYIDQFRPKKSPPTKEILADTYKIIEQFNQGFKKVDF